MNGFSAADMSTAAANGHAEGYQAGYADAVKAVEAGKDAAAQEAIGYRWRHSASEPWQYSNFPCGWEHQPLYAAPVAAAPDEMSPEFTDTTRAAIAWVLWHHQGGSSPIGQPLRFALGMGDHDPLPEWRIAEAKRYAELAGATTADFHKGRTSTPAAPGIDLPGWAFERPSGTDVIVISAPNGKTWIAEPDDRLQMLAAAVIDASPKGGITMVTDAMVNNPPNYTTGHCENHKKPGGCPLHNLQCDYPQCDRRQATSAAVGT